MEGEDTDGVEEGGMLTEFRQFILRGNLVDLAVAVVIGTAFTALVTATRSCPECLSDIPVGARRCAFCTSVVAAAA